MGFYGNITNTSKTQFQFDRTYSNRATMEANILTDGIYAGRYILIEYDTDLSKSLDTFPRESICKEAQLIRHLTLVMYLE